MKKAGMFVLKSFVFSFVFLFMTFVTISVFYNFDRQTPQNSASYTETTQEVQQGSGDDLMKKYWQQVAEADRLYARSKKQQERMERAMDKQEELLARWEDVIKRWEGLPEK